MKLSYPILCCVLALHAPLLATELTINATMLDYPGDPAFLAFYLTDGAGKYQRTLWISGSKVKYYRHLGNWARDSGLQKSEYDGLTGASIHSGASLSVQVNIEATLIDAGYLIRVDTAVEDLAEHRIDVEIPLTTKGAGSTVNGHGFIKSLSYTLQRR